jgi:hypothetical protein
MPLRFASGKEKNGLGRLAPQSKVPMKIPVRPTSEGLEP